MIRDLVLDREPTKVHLHLTAQRALRTDRKHVVDNEHPEHQHRIDRRATKMGVIARQRGMGPRQINNRSDRANKVIVWHRFIETKRIEKLLLVSVVPTHHRPPPPLITSKPVNHGSRSTSTDFCNNIGPERPFAERNRPVAKGLFDKLVLIVRDTVGL
jgi:hypothetical protein